MVDEHLTVMITGKESLMYSRHAGCKPTLLVGMAILGVLGLSALSPLRTGLFPSPPRDTGRPSWSREPACWW